MYYNDDQNYLGKKTKRNSEDPQANESTTNRNKHEPEQNPQTHKFKENKNIIYFDCAHYIKHKDIKRIFKKYGKIKNLQLTNNRRGWVKFSKNDPSFTLRNPNCACARFVRTQAQMVTSLEAYSEVFLNSSLILVLIIFLLSIFIFLVQILFTLCF